MGGILIVDDNANMRHLLRSFVETNTEFEVCGEAENGPDAIEKAKELQPDLILLDLTLPACWVRGHTYSQGTSPRGENHFVHYARGGRQQGVGFDV